MIQARPSPSGDAEDLLLRVHPNITDTSSIEGAAFASFGYKSFFHEDTAAAAAAEDEAAEAEAGKQAAATEETQTAAAATGAAAAAPNAPAAADDDDADLTTEEFDRIQQMLQQTQLDED